MCLPEKLNAFSKLINSCTIEYCAEYEKINLLGFIKCYTLLLHVKVLIEYQNVLQLPMYF